VTAISSSLSQLVHAVGVQAGGTHTLVLSNLGQLFSFGCGLAGRLGTGSMESVHSPQIVAAIENKKVVSFAAGAGLSLSLPPFSALQLEVV